MHDFTNRFISYLQIILIDKRAAIEKLSFP